MVVPALDPGAVIHGRYRVLRPIGKGGMGAVYEAVDLRLHNSVAVKQMIASGVDADRAFQQEAQLLAALRHPGLPVVTDFFIDSGSHFVVMQYIDGEDLKHVLAREARACAEQDVIAWGIAVLDVLSYLHQHSPPIVHRDIKPANLKLTPRGEILVLDFGLAKGGLQPQSDNEGRSIYGFTANYAPIEQFEWHPTDARSDLYALGATLFHLATGVAPLPAPTRAAEIASGHPDPLVPANRINQEVSRELSDVLACALELDPTLRFQSASEMRDALSRDRRPAATSTRKKASGARRVDAAIPSQAQVGQQVDLIVQVRFADSPLLGLEDWPSKRRPDQIEQGSEPLHVDYPIDRRTGRQLPARLRIKIVAPDFIIDGAHEHLIEVPPEEYSKRLAFLITPRRAGYCRVNVEVYAVDAVYLGTVPIEAEAIAAPIANPVVRVAHLVLGLFTHAESVVAAEPPEEMARTTLALQASPIPSATIAFDPPQRAAVGPVPAGVTQLPPPMAATTPTRSRLPRWMFIAAPMAVLTTALVLFQISGPMSRDIPIATPVPQSATPSTATAPPAEAPPSVLTPPPATGGTASPMQPSPLAPTAKPAPSPAAAAAPRAPVQPPPSKPGPTPGGSAGGAGRPVGETPSPVPLPGTMPDIPAPPPGPGLRPTAGAPALSPPPLPRIVASVRGSNNPLVALQITRVDRPGPGVVRVSLRVHNSASEPAVIRIDNTRTRMTRAGDFVYFFSADAAKTTTGTFNTVVPPGNELLHWIEFAVPDDASGIFSLSIATPTDDERAVRFGSLRFALPPR